MRRLAPVLLLLAACHATARSDDPVARDQEIARDILWHFHNTAALADVTVDCREGVVRLAGRVRSPQDKIEAERFASTVRGVRGVTNAIEVRPK